MPKTLYYAGIGSRETPKDVLNMMCEIGLQLAQEGWVLRSGGAHGADTAFYLGAANGKGKHQIFLPWEGFNGYTKNDPGFYVPEYTQEHLSIAAHFHPAWNSCSAGAKKMHARNVCQVAGLDLNTKSDLIICWTKDGKRGGGTGQALRIAEHLEIPIFDIAVGDIDELAQFCTEMGETNGRS